MIVHITSIRIQTDQRYDNVIVMLINNNNDNDDYNDNNNNNEDDSTSHRSYFWSPLNDSICKGGQKHMCYEGTVCKNFLDVVKKNGCKIIKQQHCDWNDLFAQNNVDSPDVLSLVR
jgi:hypothetical protein